MTTISEDLQRQIFSYLEPYNVPLWALGDYIKDSWDAWLCEWVGCNVYEMGFSRLSPRKKVSIFIDYMNDFSVYEKPFQFGLKLINEIKPTNIVVYYTTVYSRALQHMDYIKSIIPESCSITYFKMERL